MFDEKQLNEFINKIFNNAVESRNNNTSIKEGLATFRKYLDETNMCTSEYLEKLDKIILCSNELLALKVKVTSLDVTSIIESTPKPTSKPNNLSNYPDQSKEKKKSLQPSYNPTGNHRQHYVEETYSSSCGGGRTTYRGC